MVATFNTVDLKDLWLSKLTSQIAEEKSREVPKMVTLRILNKEMPGYASVSSWLLLKLLIELIFGADQTLWV
jgi:hypothetical protein